LQRREWREVEGIKLRNHQMVRMMYQSIEEETIEQKPKESNLEIIKCMGCASVN
jgi:hypothetical protein